MNTTITVLLIAIFSAAFFFIGRKTTPLDRSFDPKDFDSMSYSVKWVGRTMTVIEKSEPPRAIIRINYGADKFE